MKMKCSKPIMCIQADRFYRNNLKASANNKPFAKTNDKRQYSFVKNPYLRTISFKILKYRCP